MFFLSYSTQSHSYSPLFCHFFFFNDTATTEIYTLSLHDALPISSRFTRITDRTRSCAARSPCTCPWPRPAGRGRRSEEHTSELQSLTNLVCRLLLEKKKKENEVKQEHVD